VALQIAQQIRGRLPYKRVVKQAVVAVMRSGAEGVKVKISGRLDGAEMARADQFREGAVPLHTLRNDIDYAIVEAHTIYGRIGVKVWIARGEVMVNTRRLIAGKLERIPRIDKGIARPRAE